MLNSYDENQLALELDGGQHTDTARYDERRNAWLRAQGIEVLRFWNNQALTETEAVMETIYRALTSTDLTTSLTPSRLRPPRFALPACGRGESSA